MTSLGSQIHHGSHSYVRGHFDSLAKMRVSNPHTSQHCPVNRAIIISSPEPFIQGDTTEDLLMAGHRAGHWDQKE